MQIPIWLFIALCVFALIGILYSIGIVLVLIDWWLYERWGMSILVD
jgi:hypothetical protein